MENEKALDILEERIAVLRDYVESQGINPFATCRAEYLKGYANCLLVMKIIDKNHWMELCERVDKIIGI